MVESSTTFEPAVGLIGLPMFPSLGIGVVGVPTKFPVDSNDVDESKNLIDDPETFEQTKWQDEHQIEPEQRKKLLDSLEPLLRENAAIPPGTLCSHPAAVVTLDVGESDAKPVYVDRTSLNTRFRISWNLSLMSKYKHGPMNGSLLTLRQIRHGTHHC